ncbi:MAG: hypothetical protein JXB88_02885 [Spirochaetales bacterium]|nr:hypothetical protein [Spirochaetales bacterium]
MAKKKHMENKPYRIFGHNIDMEGNLSYSPDNVSYKLLVTIDDDVIQGEKDLKVETIETGEFVVTGIEGNFESDPQGNWIKEGWQKLNKMIKQKGYSVKCPARYYEEVLEPSESGNLRLDLYLEIKQ